MHLCMYTSFYKHKTNCFKCSTIFTQFLLTYRSTPTKVNKYTKRKNATGFRGM